MSTLNAEQLDDEMALPEISMEAYEKIDRWARVLDETPKIDKRTIFKAAATDLFAEAQRETDLAAYQAINDAIYNIGRDHAGLDHEDVDFVMVGAECDAKVAGGRPVLEGHANGHAASAKPPAVSGPDDYGPDDYGAEASRPSPIAPAAFITPQDWPQEAPPPVDWLAAGRMPRGDVTTLHGDGGAGKTDIATHLAASCARRAPYWLGHEIAGGAVVLVSAEEPERELRRRIWLHGRRDGYDPADLTDLHLWFPDDVAGAVLAVPDRNGIMQPTPLFRSIAAAIASVAPVLVVVDNVAATFAGNQNDRVMVRSYVNLWRAIARQPSAPAVLLLDHPSLSGLTGGTGRGGHTDWRNAVRSALYLRVPDDKAEADRGIRILETVKSNYGPPGNPIRLQWAEGGLVLEHAPSSLHRLAKDAECDEIFLRLLDERNAQGRPVSDKSGKNYAPAVFSEMGDNGGFTTKAFAGAMDRLFESRKIALRPQRRDGKVRDVLDRAEAMPGAAA